MLALLGDEAAFEAADAYLPACWRYVELNPVRARMMDDLAAARPREEYARYKGRCRGESRASANRWQRFGHLWASGLPSIDASVLRGLAEKHSLSLFFHSYFSKILSGSGPVFRQTRAAKQMKQKAPEYEIDLIQGAFSLSTVPSTNRHATRKPGPHRLGRTREQYPIFKQLDEIIGVREMQQTDAKFPRVWSRVIGGAGLSLAMILAETAVAAPPPNGPLDEVLQRLSAIEDALSQVPTQTDLSEIESRITTLQSRVSAVQFSVQRIQAEVNGLEGDVANIAGAPAGHEFALRLGEEDKPSLSKFAVYSNF